MGSYEVTTSAECGFWMDEGRFLEDEVLEVLGGVGGINSGYYLIGVAAFFLVRMVLLFLLISTIFIHYYFHKIILFIK